MNFINLVDQQFDLCRIRKFYKNLGIVNILFTEAFSDHKAVRTTVSVKGLPKNSLIMVDAIALANDYH